jgi:tetratricopeptide (TPR) repeat protein
MKITRVTLENFMSHRRSSLDLSRGINVVMGGNGTGKSAIAEAIRFALLGTTRVTDARGAGAFDTIGPWGETAEVEIEIEGKGTVRRVAAMDGTELSVSWAVGGKAMLQQSILDTVGGSADQVRAVLDASHVFHMPPDTQQKLLQGLVDFRVTPGKLFLALGEAGCTPEDLRFLAGLPQLKNADGLSGADLEAVYKDIYTARTAAGKDKEKARPQGLAPDLVQKRLTAEEITRKVTALTAEIGELETRQRELQVGVGGARERAKALAIAQEQLNRLSETEPVFVALTDTSVLESDLEGFKEAHAEAAAATAKAAELLEDATDSRDEAVAAANATLAEHERANAEVVRLEAGTCPTCSRPIAESKTALDLMKRDAKAVGTKAARALQAAKNAVKEAQSVHADAQQAHERASTHENNIVASLNDAQDRLTKTLDENSHLKGDRETALERHEEALRALQAQIEDLSGQEDVTTQEGELDAIRDQLTLKRGRVAELQGIAKQLASYDQALDAYQRLVERHATLDRLATMLNRKAVPAILARDLVAPFLETINGRLAELTGDEIRLTCELGDSGIELRVSVRESRALPTAALSESEKIRLGVVFAEAVSRQTGIGILLIDRGDSLEDRYRAALTSMLYGVLEDHQNVIVIATGTPKMATAEDLGVFVVADGTVKMIEPALEGEPVGTE